MILPSELILFIILPLSLNLYFSGITKSYPHLLGDGEKVTTADFIDACKWHNGFRKQTRKLPKAFNMKILDFDDYNRAHVSEDEFMAYLQQTAQDGDYTKERDGVVYYFNSFGCKLAEYNRNEGWGETF